MTMRIEGLILAAKERNASDIHIVCGLPVKCRVLGRLESMTEETLSHEDCESLAVQLAGEEGYEKYIVEGEVDLALTICDTRVRVNIFSQQGHSSLALRLLQDRIPPLEALGLPPAVYSFTTLRRGIVLVTGQTGSGKSTTLAAILNEINHTRREHILTLEDPIEYIYTPHQAIINQREIGRDTQSYAAGLRAALREDPDVILIGEMRDAVTMETALTAAETGHLVFATLHTGSAADAIDRIVDSFAEEKQRQIRSQLSMTLAGVLSQQLVPRRDGRGRVAACELMLVNHAIRNLIREGKTAQISNTIATTADIGATTMDASLLRLVRGRQITQETAVQFASDAEYVRKNSSF